ncbi:hypothetical protein Tco_0761840 [Tanacetum coccineum]
MPIKKFNVLTQHLQDIMEESLPTMVDNQVKELTKSQVPVYVAHGIIIERQQNQADVAKMIADAIKQERENIRSEIFSQINDAITNHIPSPSSVRLRDQDDPHDVAHPKGENSEKRQKTSEHETFVFGKSSSGQDFKSKPGPSTSDNQEQLDDFDFWTDSYATDDDEIPNEKVSQDLWMKCPEKIVLSLHKFPAVIFPDDDIEERTSRWKQKEPGKPKEAVYSNSKIIQIIKTYWELRHEYKFITEIIARRANDIIVSITESDYKNLNKNDIEDMYLLVINNKVDDYAETNNLTAPTITFPGIKKYKMFSIVSEPVVLEGLKSYNNDVKHKYVTQSLSNKYVEYLQLFMEEIEERLKHRDQMRRWEMYVNERPLGSRRECPE